MQEKTSVNTFAALAVGFLLRFQNRKLAQPSGSKLLENAHFRRNAAGCSMMCCVHWSLEEISTSKVSSNTYDDVFASVFVDSQLL